jgi:hypothetical protein
MSAIRCVLCVYVSNVIDAWTTVYAGSDDERSTSDPDARWRQCEELRYLMRTSQCVVSHTHCSVFPAAGCMSRSDMLLLCGVHWDVFWVPFYSRRIFCISICVCVVYMYVNYHNICVISCVRRTCVGPSCWPGSGSRPPGGVTNCEVGVARASRRRLEQIAVSECVY